MPRKHPARLNHVNTCERCGYQWHSMTTRKRPLQCPRCRSTYWHIQQELYSPRVYQRDCLVCGYRWRGIAKIPNRCANRACQTREWGKDRPVVLLHCHTCQLCGHRWDDLRDDPEQCPECKSDVWMNFVLPWLHCERCNKWFWSRSGDKATQCIFCQSRAWTVSRARMPKPRVIKTIRPTQRAKP